MDVKVSNTVSAVPTPQYQIEIPSSKSVFGRTVKAVYTSCENLLQKLDHYLPATRVALGALNITPLAGPVSSMLRQEHRRSSELTALLEENLNLLTTADVLSADTQFNQAAVTIRNQAEKLQGLAAVHEQNAKAPLSATTTAFAIGMPGLGALVLDLPWTLLASAINYVLYRVAHDTNCTSEAELAASENRMSDNLLRHATHIEDKARNFAMLEQQTRQISNHQKTIQQLHSKLNKSGQKQEQLAQELEQARHQKTSRPRISVSRHKTRMERAEKELTECKSQLRASHRSYTSLAKHNEDLEKNLREKQTGYLKNKLSYEEQLTHSSHQIQILEEKLATTQARVKALQTKAFDAAEELECMQASLAAKEANIESIRHHHGEVMRKHMSNSEKLTTQLTETEKRASLVEQQSKALSKTLSKALLAVRIELAKTKNELTSARTALSTQEEQLQRADTLLQENEKLKLKIVNLRSSLGKKTGELAFKESLLTNAQTELKKYFTANQDLDYEKQEAVKLQHQIAEERDKISEQYSELSLELDNRTQTLGAQHDALLFEFDTLTSKVEALKEQLVSKIWDDLASEIDQHRDQHERDVLQIEQLYSLQDETDSEVSALKAEVAGLKPLAERVTELEKEKASLLEQICEFEIQLETQQ